MAVNEKLLTIRLFCLLCLPFASGILGVFKKYHNKKLDTNQLSYGMSVKGVFGCEKECLKRRDVCDAANVMPVKPFWFDCNFIKNVKLADITPDKLLPNPGGKFILHQGEYTQSIISH